MEAKQTGITFNIQIALSKQLQFSFFGTYQENHLLNYCPLSVEALTQRMITSVIKTYYTTKAMTGTGQIIGGIRTDSLINSENKATPDFYGGASINYSPIEKLSLNASVYYYTKQTFTTNLGSMDIEPKALLNLKVSYKVWKNNSVYISGRNILDMFGKNNQQEFGFLDKIGATYFVGLNINF